MSPHDEDNEHGLPNPSSSDEASASSSQNILTTTWQNNKGVFLILLAQMTGSTMDAIVRYLQQQSGGHGMHPFQAIFARMSVTALLSSVYMWWTRVPDFPLGAKAVRGLLVLRAMAGFGGLFCLYYSVHYLPLSEATVFRFLVPIITAWACSLFLGQAFTKSEFTAGIVALLGVVIIAHPAIIFGRDAAESNNNNSTSPSNKIDHVTSGQRLLAIAVSVIGVLGASAAYTLIRIIGSRAHALISVNYFALISTIGSAAALLILPGMQFTMPRSLREWMLLTLLGVLGFVLQFLLTAGLQLDKTSKATSMLYTGILFALAFDWVIWGVLPGVWSFVGGGIVVGSTLWSALQKSKGGDGVRKDVAVVVIDDEESALLGAATQSEGHGKGQVARRASA